MSEIIDQITLFHALKLKPNSNEETIRWDFEMDKHLISLVHRNKCSVYIEKCVIRVKKAKKKVEIQPSTRVLRSQKKKQCFIYIEKIKKSIVHVKKAKKKTEIAPSSRVLRPRNKKKYYLCSICVSDKFILQLKKAEILILFRICFFLSCLININSDDIHDQ